MLLNFILYIYIALFSHTYGLILWTITRKCGIIRNEIIKPRFFDLLFSGIVFLFFILGVYSVFYKTGAVIHISLLITGILFAFFNRTYYKQLISDLYLLKINRYVLFPGLIYLLILLLYSSDNTLYYAYDTGLYHAKFVQWMNDFKAIKGLGNLDGRLGFNSHFHLLCAFFSLSFLRGSPFHALNGFITFIFLMYSMNEINKALANKHTNYVVILILFLASYFYLFRFYIYGMYADPFGIVFAFYIVISLINRKETNTDFQFDHSFFVLLSASASVILFKLSYSFLLLIPIYFGIWIKIINKQMGEAIKTSVIIILLLTPWLIRNMIMTGYLIYPMHYLDIFNYDWKIPANKVIHEENIIENFSRLAGVVTDANLSFSTWFAVWIGKESIASKLLLLLLGCSLVTFSFLIFKGKKVTRRLLALFMIFFTGALFTYYQSPKLRFVCVYSIACIGLTLFTLTGNISKRQLNYLLISVAFIVGIQIIRDPVYLIRHNQAMTFNHLLIPEDYPPVKTIEMKANNLSVYIPEDGNQCWNAGLFCIDPRFYDRNLMFRGKSVEDGFRCVK